MNNLIDTTNESAFIYANSLNSQMDQICSPLRKYFNIQVFAYLRIFKNCSYIRLSSGGRKFQKYYFQNIHDQGEVFGKFIKGAHIDVPSYKLFPKYPPHNDSLLSPAYEHNIWHGFAIGNKTQHYYETYVFMFERNVSNKTDFFLNNINILHKFINYFKIATRELVDCSDKSKLGVYKNKFDPNLRATKKNNFLTDIRKKYKFISTSELNALTNQESRCIEFLAQGRTMKEIGRILSISPRTVESYIENVKDKTGCNFKSQIIDLYHNNKSWIDV